MVANSSRQPSVVGTNPYGDYKGTLSMDSMEKNSLALNSSADDTRSYDIYGGQVAHQGVAFGSHLSPGSQNFLDRHEVHYAQGGATNNVNATVHRPGSTYDDMAFENRAYRPETRQSQVQQENPETGSLWHADGLSLGPPGYSSNKVSNVNIEQADSVLDFKRDLANQLAKEVSGRDPEDSANTSDTQTSQSTDLEYQTMDQDYQTMDRESHYGGHNQTSFRPPSQNVYSSNVQDQTLPLSKPHLTQPSIPQHVETIPSVPGYAKPFAHQNGTLNSHQNGAINSHQNGTINSLHQNGTMNSPRQNGTMNSQRGPSQRPYHPPPQPPQQQRPQSEFILRNHQLLDADPNRPMETSLDPLPPPPPSNQSTRLLETSLDDPPPNSRHPTRTKSIGALLETNLDEDTSNPMFSRHHQNGHSRSMSNVNSGNLSLGTSLLESDL